MNSSSRFAGTAAALVAALALATAAHAGDPLKCKQQIGKGFAKYVQARTKALQKCNDSVAKAKFVGSCPDVAATLKIAKANSKARAGIGKQCGGSTKSCTDGDALALSAIGWNLGTCPNLETGPCNNALVNCDDVSDCLLCIGDSAVDQVISLYYDDLSAGQFGTGSAINKCQIAIGKSAAKFLGAKNKALQKCENGILKGTVIGPCPDAIKALPAINKAESKKQAGICKACGGTDKLCGGAADLTPAVIGFASNCPDVTVPGGAACAGAITTAQNIVDCVDCVSEFKADCLDALSVPSIKTYPTACNPPTPTPTSTVPLCAATPNDTATPCPTATPGIICPTQVVTEANGGAVDLDTGWTGQSHDAHAPSQNRLTQSVTTCSNPDASTCGVCTTLGPLPNAGGTAYNTQRCDLDTSVQCTSDGDCAGIPICNGGGNNGASCTMSSECPGGSCPASACVFFFGSPLPLSAGGVSVCVTNEIIGSVSGTIDIEAGTTLTNLQLLSRVHTGPTGDKPCPTCDAGVCNGGPRDTQACVVNGISALFGNVSFDCPPSPAADVGSLPISIVYSTGTQTATLSAANPTCSAPGFSGKRCFCDTCNNVNGTPCTNNADCTAVSAECVGGLNSGANCVANSECPSGTCAGATVCGGKRCVGGTNAGAACSANSECPGSLACTHIGQNTKPNDCSNFICSPVMTCVGGCNDFLNCTGAFKCAGGSNNLALCTLDSECPGGSCAEQCPGGACVSGNEGTCAAGPVENFCAIQTFRGCKEHCVGGSNNNTGCANNSECPGGSCERDVDCPLPGDTCTLTKVRDCFTDNGNIGGSVTATGVPYPSCGGVGTGTVGALFCVPPTSSGSVNSVSGLPGLGRITLPYTATFN